MGLLKVAIEEYVSTQLKNYKPQFVKAPKVIHDSIWGSNLFMSHEIAVLDLPIVQRLRRISQVAVASLVYPSGNHNRFEHSLGVAVIGEQLVNGLYRKIKEGKRRNIEPYKSIEIDEQYVLRHVKIAGILHDVGHGPFSHLSEKVYKNFSDILAEEAENEKLSGASAHEILSYLIVTSPTFKEFFKNEISNVYNVDIDLDLIGEMIIGYVSDSKKAFMVDIINGTFDADKLDYIQRDSHFTGIKMVLDLHRLFYTLDLISQGDNVRLSVDISGVSTLEQIIFNKMMLFTTVYHHHKVRAAESVFKALVEEIKKNNIKFKGKAIKTAADFLYLTDDDIFGLRGNKNKKISSLANRLYERILPKRALVISRKTSKTNVEELEKFNKIVKNEKQLLNLRKLISQKTEEMGDPVSVDDILIDAQPGPHFKEAIQCPVKSVGESNGFVTLHQILPVDDWVKAFSQNKWAGYIYTLPEKGKTVCIAAQAVFKEVLGIEFNSFARILSKIDEQKESS